MQPSAFVDDVRALFTDELWERRGRRLLAEVTWPPGVGADAARAAPRPRGRRAGTGAAAARRAREPSGAGRARRARDRAGARRWRRSPRCGVRWLVERVLRPSRIEPDPEPMRRGSVAHAVLERTLGCGATGRRADARSRCPRRSTRSPPRWTSSREGAGRRAAGRRCARSRSTCGGSCATRPRPAPASSRAARVELRRRERRAAGAGRDRRVTGRVDRIDVDAGRPRARARLQGPARVGRRALGGGPAAAGGAVRARGARAARAEPAGALYQPLGAARPAPARARPRRRRPARYVDGDVVDAEAFDAALEERARDGARARRATCAPAGSAPCPDALHAAGRLRLPGHLPRARGGRATALADAARTGRRSRPSSGRRSRTAPAPRCSPPTPGPARPP